MCPLKCYSAILLTLFPLCQGDQIVLPNDSFLTEAMECLTDAILHHNVFDQVSRDCGNKNSPVGTINGTQNLNGLISGHGVVWCRLGT